VHSSHFLKPESGAPGKALYAEVLGEFLRKQIPRPRQNPTIGLGMTPCFLLDGETTQRQRVIGEVRLASEGVVAQFPHPHADTGVWGTRRHF